MSTRIKFTPEILKAIPEWLASGATTADIADVLGTSINSLQVVCSRVGISLRRSGGECDPNVHSHLRRALSQKAWEGLCAEAKRREMPVVHMAFTMLEYAAIDNLYSAIIDDEQGRCESSVVQRRNVG